MPTALAYAIIIPLVVVCFIATAFMIWDLWHIPTIYVDGDE